MTLEQAHRREQVSLLVRVAVAFRSWRGRGRCGIVDRSLLRRRRMRRVRVDVCIVSWQVFVLGRMHV